MARKDLNFAHLLQQGFTAHQRGNLAEAERCYETILGAKRNQFDALHLLGVVRLQQGRAEEAIDLIGKALRINPRSPAAHVNLGAAFGALKRLNEALGCYDKALTFDRDHLLALNSRAATLLDLGRPEEGLASLDRALAINPSNVETLRRRGQVLWQMKRLDEALACCETLLAIDPNRADALSNRGTILQALNRMDEALASYDEALAIKSDHADALNNRGNLLSKLGRLDEALASYDRAVAISPGNADVPYNRGNVLQGLRRFEPALASYDAALAIHPSHVEALNSRGAVLRHLRRTEEALECYDKALSFAPFHAAALGNRGLILRDLRRFGESLAGYHAALAIQPDQTAALKNLGDGLVDLRRPVEAFASYDRALAIDPGDSGAYSNKIIAADFVPGLDFASQQRLRRGWARIHADRFSGEVSPHTNDRNPSRRIRLGYVSADFMKHSAAHIFGPVLRRHDRTAFEVACYSGVAIEDEMTEAFRRASDLWRPVGHLTDDALAAQIRSDGIDILVDLSGHSAGHRLLAFARKPAPIQVEAWGQASGTGLAAIDYLFSDPVTIPAEARPLFAETVVDLPSVIICEMPADAPAAGESPAGTRGFVTFGCLNRFSKVSPAVLGLWARILRSVPRSRLLLKDPAFEDVSMRRAAQATLVEGGIEVDRLELRGHSSHRDHLAAYNDIDIAFDPFPHNGGASTWEALRMGCPVVARLGDHAAGRQSAAILRSAGFGAWTAESDEAYFDLAVQKASDLAGLVQLRRRIPALVATSPAGNPEAYTRHAEAAYRSMWERWCRQ